MELPVVGGFRGGAFFAGGGTDPPCVGGVYPAAARARCIIASISSFVFVDFGMGTNGIFILVTGNGACPFALGVEPGGNAFGGMVDAWLFPGGTTFGGGGGGALLTYMGVGPVTALAVDVVDIGVRETFGGVFGFITFLVSAAGFLDVVADDFEPFGPVIVAKSIPSIAALAASTPAAIAAKSTTIEALPAVEDVSLSGFDDLVTDAITCLLSFGPDKDIEASDRDARDNEARESNLGLPLGCCPLEFDPPLFARLRRFEESTESSPTPSATAMISSMRPVSFSAE